MLGQCQAQDKFAIQFLKSTIKEERFRFQENIDKLNPTFLFQQISRQQPVKKHQNQNQTTVSQSPQVKQNQKQQTNEKEQSQTLQDSIRNTAQQNIQDQNFNQIKYYFSQKKFQTYQEVYQAKRKQIGLNKIISQIQIQKIKANLKLYQIKIVSFDNGDKVTIRQIIRQSNRAFQIRIHMGIFLIQLSIFNLIDQNYDFNTLEKKKIKIRKFLFEEHQIVQKFLFLITDDNSASKVKKIQQYKPEFIKVLKEIAFMKIFCALKIGPKFCTPFGFDAIRYKNGISFNMQLCYAISPQLRFDQSKRSFHKQISKKDIQDLKDALNLMHHLKIIHGDIKTENIMYSSSWKKCIFIDFGNTSSLKENHHQATKLKGLLATFNWFSPQMKQYRSIYFSCNSQKVKLNLYINDLEVFLIFMSKCYCLQKQSLNINYQIQEDQQMLMAQKDQILKNINIFIHIEETVKLQWIRFFHHFYANNFQLLKEDIIFFISSQKCVNIQKQDILKILLKIIEKAEPQITKSFYATQFTIEALQFFKWFKRIKHKHPIFFKTFCQTHLYWRREHVSAQLAKNILSLPKSTLKRDLMLQNLAQSSTSLVNSEIGSSSFYNLISKPNFLKTQKTLLKLKKIYQKYYSLKNKGQCLTFDNNKMKQTIQIYVFYMSLRRRIGSTKFEIRKQISKYFSKMINSQNRQNLQVSKVQTINFKIYFDHIRNYFKDLMGINFLDFQLILENYLQIIIWCINLNSQEYILQSKSLCGQRQIKQFQVKSLIQVEYNLTMYGYYSEQLHNQLMQFIINTTIQSKKKDKKQNKGFEILQILNFMFDLKQLQLLSFFTCLTRFEMGYFQKLRKKQSFCKKSSEFQSFDNDQKNHYFKSFEKQCLNTLQKHIIDAKQSIEYKTINLYLKLLDNCQNNVASLEFKQLKIKAYQLFLKNPQELLKFYMIFIHFYIQRNVNLENQFKSFDSQFNEIIKMHQLYSQYQKQQNPLEEQIDSLPFHLLQFYKHPYHQPPILMIFQYLRPLQKRIKHFIEDQIYKILDQIIWYKEIMRQYEVVNRVKLEYELQSYAISSKTFLDLRLIDRVSLAVAFLWKNRRPLSIDNCLILLVSHYFVQKTINQEQCFNYTQNKHHKTLKQYYDKLKKIVFYVISHNLKFLFDKLQHSINYQKSLDQLTEMIQRYSKYKQIAQYYVNHNQKHKNEIFAQKFRQQVNEYTKIFIFIINYFQTKKQKLLTDLKQKQKAIRKIKDIKLFIKQNHSIQQLIFIKQKIEIIIIRLKLSNSDTKYKILTKKTNLQLENYSLLLNSFLDKYFKEYNELERIQNNLFLHILFILDTLLKVYDLLINELRENISNINNTKQAQQSKQSKQNWNQKYQQINTILNDQKSTLNSMLLTAFYSIYNKTRNYFLFSQFLKISLHLQSLLIRFLYSLNKRKQDQEEHYDKYYDFSKTIKLESKHKLSFFANIILSYPKAKQTIENRLKNKLQLRNNIVKNTKHKQIQEVQKQKKILTQQVRNQVWNQISFQTKVKLTFQFIYSFFVSIAQNNYLSYPHGQKNILLGVYWNFFGKIQLPYLINFNNYFYEYFGLKCFSQKQKTKTNSYDENNKLLQDNNKKCTDFNNLFSFQDRLNEYYEINQLIVIKNKYSDISTKSSMIIFLQNQNNTYIHNFFFDMTRQIINSEVKENFEGITLFSVSQIYRRQNLLKNIIFLRNICLKNRWSRQQLKFQRKDYQNPIFFNSKREEYSSKYDQQQIKNTILNYIKKPIKTFQKLIQKKTQIRKKDILQINKLQIISILQELQAIDKIKQDIKGNQILNNIKLQERENYMNMKNPFLKQKIRQQLNQEEKDNNLITKTRLNDQLQKIKSFIQLRDNFFRQTIQQKITKKKLNLNSIKKLKLVKKHKIIKKRNRNTNRFKKYEKKIINKKQKQFIKKVQKKIIKINIDANNYKQKKLFYAEERDLDILLICQSTYRSYYSRSKIFCNQYRERWIQLQEEPQRLILDKQSLLIAEFVNFYTVFRKKYDTFIAYCRLIQKLNRIEIKTKILKDKQSFNTNDINRTIKTERQVKYQSIVNKILKNRNIHSILRHQNMQLLQKMTILVPKSKRQHQKAILQQKQKQLQKFTPKDIISQQSNYISYKKQSQQKQQYQITESSTQQNKSYETTRQKQLKLILKKAKIYKQAYARLITKNVRMKQHTIQYTMDNSQQ